MTLKNTTQAPRPMHRRLWRLGWLLVNLGACVRFAGGLLGFLKRALSALAAGQWRHLVAWMVMAVSFVYRTDEKRYRRWLASLPPVAAPDGHVRAVVSCVGVPAHQLLDFLAVLSAHRKPWLELIVVVEPEQRGDVVAQFEAAGLAASVMDSAGNGGRDMLAGLRRAVADGMDFRYVALLAPGCVPGDMPLAAAGKTLIFGDEDEATRHGVHNPTFKPGFSPDLLLYADYLSSCLILTAELARELAMLPEECAKDLHSLALMAHEAADQVQHLGAFTVHRFLPAPDAEMPAELPRYLHRRYGEVASVNQSADGWVCRFGSARPLVSIIIPTRDRIDLLAPCVESIYRTNHGAFEVIVIDNGSEAPETKRWLASAASRWESFRVVAAPEPFNWSRLNNLGMSEAAGEVFLFLNNDTEALHDDWVERLADVALRDDVGAVGGLLLYPDGTIQHAGVVTGFGGCADHIYVGTKPDAGGELFVPPTVPRNVSAVTGACLAVSRRTVEAIGLFDEGYAVIGSDVEFCLRAMRAGLLNVYLPHVRLVHHESQSRNRKDPEADVERLRTLIAAHPPDPYFNPSLSMISLYPSYRI